MDIFTQIAIIQQMIVALPDWIHVLTLFVTAASALAALTPTTADDTVVGKLMSIVDWLALNFGNAGAHNKAPTVVVQSLAKLEEEKPLAGPRVGRKK